MASYIKRLLQIRANNAVEGLSVVKGILDLCSVQLKGGGTEERSIHRGCFPDGKAAAINTRTYRHGLAPVKVADGRAHDLQGVHVINRKVVGHARDTRVKVSTAEVLGGDLLARSCLDQGLKIDEGI